MNIAFPLNPNTGGGGGTASEVVYDTIAELRASTETADRVFVLEHTSGTGVGGGEFRKIDGTLTPGDIGGGGDDDNGLTIVLANGTAYARDAAICQPEDFGVVPYKTEVAAAAGSDQSAMLKRWIDFWSDPTSFGGFASWPAPLKQRREFHAYERFYRCHETLDLIIPMANPWWYGSTERPTLTFHGMLYTPRDIEIPAVRVDIERNAGKSPIKIRCFKQLAADGKTVWNAKPFPELYRDPGAYPSFSASSPQYKDDLITATATSGELFLYEVQTTGTAGFTPPNHTTGTATLNGITYKALGSIQTTGGLWSRECLQRSTDIGVWIDNCDGLYDIDIETMNYEMGIAIVPKSDSANACGFATITGRQQFGCRVGIFHASFLFDQEVADSAARLALTGLPKNWVVRQTNDASFDYRFNGPLGTEATPGSWSTMTKNASTNWTNDVRIATNLLYGRGPGTIIDTDKSVYGVVTSMFNGSSPPDGNDYREIGVEFSDQSGNAEQVMICFDCGNENTAKVRNDLESRGTAALFLPHSEAETTTEPYRNKVDAVRAGYWSISSFGNRRHHNNQHFNVVDQAPYARKDVVEFSVPSLIEDATFSGYNRVYFNKTTPWASNAVGPNRYGVYRYADNSPDQRYWYLNVDDMSFEVSPFDCPAVFVDIPHNPTGDAYIEIYSHFSQIDESTQNNARFELAVEDPLNPGTWLDWSGRPRHPFQSKPSSGNGNFQSNFYRYIANNFSVGPETIGVEPWVKRVCVRLWGNRMRGYTVRLYNAWGGSVYSPNNQRPFPGRRLEAKPERGIYRAPFDAAYLAPSAGNARVYLNKPVSNIDWWAVSDLYTNIGSPALWQWAHDGSGNILEYQPVGWTQIATGVSHVLPSDFVNY